MGSDCIMDYKYWKEPESDSLMHYGVLGMRWGVRKAKKAIKSGYTSMDTVAYYNTKRKYGTTRSDEAKKYLSGTRDRLRRASAQRQIEAEKALRANKGNKGIKSSFVADEESTRNSKLSSPLFDTFKPERGLSMIGGAAAGLAQLADLKRETLSMSIKDVEKVVNAYIAESYKSYKVR